MNVPLRNTKQTLAMAGIEENKGVTQLGFVNSTWTNPVYKVPEHLMEGVEGKEFLVNNKDDEEEVARVVEEATKEVLRRTGGVGFPIFGGYREDAVKRGVERAGASTLVYYGDNFNSTCSEVEVEEWLRRRRSGEEDRVLFADFEVSRGWECSHVLVINLGGTLEKMQNYVMRTVGFCALVWSLNP